MAIKKVLSVKNVGRLVNCTQKGPELNRYNLFFAENGCGKTTLCAVLRSFQTGQHDQYHREEDHLADGWRAGGLASYRHGQRHLRQESLDRHPAGDRNF